MTRYRSVLVVVVVAVLVGLAGCNAFGGVPTARETFGVGDEEGPSTTRDTGSVDGGEPVIAFDPLRDTAPAAFDLVDAHYDALDGESYQVEYTHLVQRANRTVLSEAVTTTYSANHSRYVHHRVSSVQNETVVRYRYSNGSHVWIRNGNTSPVAPISRTASVKANGIAATPNPPRPARAALERGLVAMQATDVRALDTVPSGVERQLFRVTMTESTLANPYGDRTLDATLTLFVTESGRIVEYHYAYSYVEDGQTFHVETRVEFRGFGTVTVDRPDWASSNATRQTPQTSHR